MVLKSRGHFTNKFGFIAAAAGSAVGLGNIWKFPYEAGLHGGAAFLLVYFILTFVICYPIMVGEISIGRRSQKNIYSSYTGIGGKKWGLLGILGILCGIMILSFYNVVAGWAFGYFLEISFGSLLKTPDYGTFFSSYVVNFWDNLLYSLCFMVITAFIVSRGVQKGIESAAKIMMPLLFFILITLIIYSLTLDNAGKGVAFYLLPDFSKINLPTIYSAMGHAFFSLSLGMGALITYGSYVEKKQNVVTSAAIITVMDMSVAFLAGLLIFPLVFSQTVSPAQGPALVFVVLPGIFNALGPVLGKVIGGSFFLLLCFAALTSTISLLEVPIAYFVDEKKWPRKIATWSFALLIFIIGLPSMLSMGSVEIFSVLPFYNDKSTLEFVSEVFSELCLPLGGCLMCLFIVRKWGQHNMSDEISYGNKKYLGSFLEKYINFTIKYLCPVVLAAFAIMLVLDKILGLDFMSE